GYLRWALPCTVSSTNALALPAAAASAAASTNFVAFAGPAALWIRSRSASLRRNAKTTNGTFGAFSFFGLGSFAAFGSCFSRFFLFMLASSFTGHHTSNTAMDALIRGHVKSEEACHETR